MRRVTKYTLGAVASLAAGFGVVWWLAWRADQEFLADAISQHIGAPRLLQILYNFGWSRSDRLTITEDGKNGGAVLPNGTTLTFRLLGEDSYAAGYYVTQAQGTPEGLPDRAREPGLDRAQLLQILGEEGII